MIHACSILLQYFKVTYLSTVFTIRYLTSDASPASVSKSTLLLRKIPCDYTQASCRTGFHNWIKVRITLCRSVLRSYGEGHEVTYLPHTTTLAWMYTCPWLWESSTIYYLLSRFIIRVKFRYLPDPSKQSVITSRVQIEYINIFPFASSSLFIIDLKTHQVNPDSYCTDPFQAET